MSGVVQEEEAEENLNKQTSGPQRDGITDFAENACKRRTEHEQGKEEARQERLPFQISAERDECTGQRKRIQSSLAIPAPKPSPAQQARRHEENRKVPAIGGISFVIRVYRCGKGTPAPSRRRVIDVYAKAPVHAKNNVIHTLIPMAASCAELLGSIPQDI